MNREFKRSVISAAPTVDQDGMDILAAAKKKYRGQVPADPGAHEKSTKEWLESKPLNAVDPGA